MIVELPKQECIFETNEVCWFDKNADQFISITCVCIFVDKLWKRAVLIRGLECTLG